MKRMWSKNELKEVVKGTPKDIITLVDKNGNPRFIEGAMETEEAQVSISYGKWSLSGSHLMLVVGGTFTSGTVSKGTLIGASVNLPSWIYNKVRNLKGTGVAWKTVKGFYEDWSQEEMETILATGDGKLSIYLDKATTFTGDCVFRISFDLLIDNE